MGLQGTLGQRGIGDGHAGWVLIHVETGGDGQARLRGGGADEADHGLVVDEWPAAPVDGDVGEEAVLDRVPLAGPRWQVGRWQTVMGKRTSSASSWRRTFHTRLRAPLLPPLSAKTSSESAAG